jgi:hypothetical protein
VRGWIHVIGVALVVGVFGSAAAREFSVEARYRGGLVSCGYPDAEHRVTLEARIGDCRRKNPAISDDLSDLGWAMVQTSRGETFFLDRTGGGWLWSPPVASDVNFGEAARVCQGLARKNNKAGRLSSRWEVPRSDHFGNGERRAGTAIDLNPGLFRSEWWTSSFRWDDDFIRAEYYDGGVGEIQAAVNRSNRKSVRCVSATR